MTSLTHKLADSLRQGGMGFTVRKILHSTTNRYRQLMALRFARPEDRFVSIYANNVWGSEESRSGFGSTLESTANIRKVLPEIIASLSVRTFLDAPCGDFHWMHEVLQHVNVQYIGGDIVSPLVSALQSKYGSANVSFSHIDITKDPLPSADLMLCRDCLFHLSYSDTMAFLDGFLAAEIPYLMTTTHDNSAGTIVNRDIRSGGFRPIDLFAHPYNLPREPLRTIEDWRAPDLKRYLCLWSRQQVRQARQGATAHAPGSDGAT